MWFNQKIWEGRRPNLQKIDLLQGIHHETIQRSDDTHQFFLGASMTFSDNTPVFAWGASGVDENDDQTCFSYKMGRKNHAWEKIFPSPQSADNPDRYSHGIIFNHCDQLYVFLPKAHYNKINAFPALRMEVKVFHHKTRKGISQHETAPGFWPLTAPRSLENGSWIMGGLFWTPMEKGVAAVAICSDRELAQWQVIKIPSRIKTWGETAINVQPNLIEAFIRPKKAGPMLYSTSSDYGYQWTTAKPTNLIISASKIEAGTLSTGTSFLIANFPVSGWDNRDTLAIALREPDAKNFSRLHILRQEKSPFPRYSGRGHKQQWCYPFAIEHKNQLSVVYTGTKEQVELTEIPLELL